MVRTALQIFGGLLLVLLGTGLWWHVNGPHVLYGQFSPSTEQIIGNREVPHSLPAAKWQTDLDSLAQVLRERLIYADDAYGDRRLDRRIDSLKRLVPTQTRDQRILSVAHLLTPPTPGTGHIGLSFVQRPINWSLLPVRVFRFSDGYYIVDAMETDLVGYKVEAIGGVPVDSVSSALEPWGITVFAEPLRAVGIVDRIDEIPVRLRTPKGRHVTRTLEPGGMWSPSTLRFGAFLEAPVEGEWSPAHLHPRARNYRLSYRDSTDLLYLQFNKIWDASSDWTIADLADSVRTIADTRPLDKLVVDLRNNTGGNHDLLEPLVDLFGDHPKIDRRGTLYTLLSRRTFSAAGTLAMELERRTKTVFVGEPGGFAPNVWGDTVPVLLPHSKLVGSVSYRYWQTGLPDSPRSRLTPDVQVPLTSDQHFSDEDSAMVAVRQHEPAPRKPISLSQTQRASFTGTYRLSPIHRARITGTAGGLQLLVDRGRPESGLHPFIESDLSPLSSTRPATDITDAYLERRPGSDALTLAWTDTSYVLTPVDSAYTLPTEDVWVGRFEQAAERLRAARSSGVRLDSWIARTLTSRADTLEAEGHSTEALRPSASPWSFFLSPGTSVPISARLTRRSDRPRRLRGPSEWFGRSTLAGRSTWTRNYDSWATLVKRNKVIFSFSCTLPSVNDLPSVCTGWSNPGASCFGPIRFADKLSSVAWRLGRLGSESHGHISAAVSDTTGDLGEQRNEG